MQTCENCGCEIRGGDPDDDDRFCGDCTPLESFRLTIKLGNDAMQTALDVAQAIEAVARRLRESSGHDQGRIMDANGNSVGSWAID